ncbi:hypothetical protein HY793_05215, partial [Candidatus Desantisbacteria bacterium]|nr:hypothetical protein [Candidatus Desantisbacteria bacterium]
MEKRVLLAITASALILLGYNMLVYKNVKNSPQVSKQEVVTQIQPAILAPATVSTQSKRIGLNINEEDLSFKTEVMAVKLTPLVDINSLQLLKLYEHDKSPVEIALPPV